jgi:hypothetical protein
VILRYLLIFTKSRTGKNQNLDLKRWRKSKTTSTLLGSAKHNILSIYVPGKKWSQRPQNRQKSSFYTVILHYLPICTESRTGKNQILDLKTLAEVENDLNTTWEVQNITYCPYMFLVKSGHKHLKNAKNRYFSKIVGVGLSSQEFTADFQNSQ